MCSIIEKRNRVDIFRSDFRQNCESEKTRVFYIAYRGRVDRTEGILREALVRKKEAQVRYWQLGSSLEYKGCGILNGKSRGRNRT